MDRQRKNTSQLLAIIHHQPHMAQITPEINVLHLLNGEQYAGLERVVDFLAEQAPTYGYRFHLVCLKPRDMPARLNTRNAHLHFVTMRHRMDLSGIATIRRIAVRENCRIIHSHTVRSALIAVLLRFTLSAVPWIHHVHSPAKYESENTRLNYCNYLIEKMVLPKADQLIPVSDVLRDYVMMEYHIATHKIFTVKNGVEIVPDHAIKRWMNKETKIIGMIGLLRPRKGVEVLLKAFADLVIQGHNVHLKLVGEFAHESYQAACHQWIEQAGLAAHVTCTGFQDNVRAQLNTLDVFVLPSLYGEGLPMALLEAMAMARPIIASDIGGVSGIVDASCAILVPPGDVNRLARAMSRMITNDSLSQSLARAALNRQRSSYSLDSMAINFFSTYQNFLRPSLHGVKK